MDLHTLTLHEAHQGLKAKKFSSVELTNACLERIKKIDKNIHAFVTISEKEALEMAKKADHRIATGDVPALCGIPAVLKDVFCTDGIATTACSKILKGFVPPYDATAVKRLKEAGMVLVGKANTDEFTCGASTESSCFGVTKNPWDLTRVSGGSSGGSAAAVVADECIYATGTDTGGSIRQPASFCGVTGIKVTYGRVSRFGIISMASSLDTIGTFGKDVLDISHILNVMAGQDEYDSTTSSVPVPDYTKSCNGTDLKGLTIGLPKEYFIPGMDPEVEQTVKTAIKELEKLGAKVKSVSLPHTKYGLAVYYIICPSEVSANMARYDGIRYGPGPKEIPEDLYDYYLKARSEGFGDEMKRRIMVGTYTLSAGYYEAYYLKAQKVRTLIKQDFEKAFEEVDVICAPISPTVAFHIGEKTDDPVQMYLSDVFTITINLAGVPSLAVPCGFSKENLPIGMQIIGPQFGEEVLFKIGHSYQQITDWHKRKPTLESGARLA